MLRVGVVLAPYGDDLRAAALWPCALRLIRCCFQSSCRTPTAVGIGIGIGFAGAELAVCAPQPETPHPSHIAHLHISHPPAPAPASLLDDMS